MPEYVYRCYNGHEEIITRPMADLSPVVCIYDGLGMWRKPQRVNVNWNGLKPSAGEHSPAIQTHMQDLERKRDEYQERHEAHERTAHLRSAQAV